MKRYLTFGYGALCYAVFLASFLYAVGFVGNIVVPRTVDHGITASIGEAVVVNLILLGLFAVQHSVMARPAFKRMWTHIVPPSVERSTYVLASSLALILLFAAWRPLPAAVWTIESSPARELLFGLYVAGWAIVVRPIMPAMG